MAAGAVQLGRQGWTRLKMTGGSAGMKSKCGRKEKGCCHLYIAGGGDWERKLGDGGKDTQ